MKCFVCETEMGKDIYHFYKYSSQACISVSKKEFYKMRNPSKDGLFFYLTKEEVEKILQNK